MLPGRSRAGYDNTMPVITVQSVDDYLASTYQPDREYIEGAIVERSVGERDHSELQTEFGHLSERPPTAVRYSRVCRAAHPDRADAVPDSGHLRRLRVPSDRAGIHKPAVDLHGKSSQKMIESQTSAPRQRLSRLRRSLRLGYRSEKPKGVGTHGSGQPRDRGRSPADQDRKDRNSAPGNLCVFGRIGTCSQPGLLSDVETLQVRDLDLRSRVSLGEHWPERR